MIELNRAIRETVDEDLRALVGRAVLAAAACTRTIGDGRSKLAARDTRYDVIHIGFTDTLSANSAQAFALTETNLYTLEAFDEYFDHLAPGRRPERLAPAPPGRRRGAARDRAHARGARARASSDPERNVVVVLGRDIFDELFGTVLARREPWTPRELDRIRAARATSAGRAWRSRPAGPYRLEWAELARAPRPQAFCEGYRLDVCPPTDDKPVLLQHDAGCRRRSASRRPATSTPPTRCRPAR